MDQAQFGYDCEDFSFGPEIAFGNEIEKAMAQTRQAA